MGGKQQGIGLYCQRIFEYNRSKNCMEETRVGRIKFVRSQRCRESLEPNLKVYTALLRNLERGLVEEVLYFEN